MIGFRREKGVPRGGPNGGDGGDGGSVSFLVNSNHNSLFRFHRQNHYQAGHGEHGGRQQMTGARGESLLLEVPAGTLIYNGENNNFLADLTLEGQRVTILNGGRGGRGNTRFASSTNQAPRVAERGEPGAEMWLLLELKLIADVGIVGVPNAGKSTLLSVISSARPKIAAYPFTTLQPNLGVAIINDYDTLVVADIPGLIEGASSGYGLGHEFLRHIERTRVLIHLLDGSASDPLEDWAMINQELASFATRLEDKPQLVVFNKIDLSDAVAWEPLVRERIEKAGFPFASISAVTGHGVQQLMHRVKELLDNTPEPEQTAAEIVVISPEPDDDSFRIARENGNWRVSGRNIERVAAMTYWEFEETTRRFQQILDSMGISKALIEAGVSDGDTVHIGEETLEWSD